MEECESSVRQQPEAELDEATRFDKSLQELRDLRSQLHHAANYCEATFLNAKKKQIVVENTKDYICRAVVTVVDHLGSVSANLDYRLSSTDVAPEAEIRINCLRQRLSTHLQYSNKLALSKACLNADFLRFHPRYIAPRNDLILFLQFFRSNPSAYDISESGSPLAVKTRAKHEFKAEEEVPLFLYTYNFKPSLVRNLANDEGAKKRDGFSAPALSLYFDDCSVASSRLLAIATKTSACFISFSGDAQDKAQHGKAENSAE
ncbi:hypothetical protein RJ639_032230 [Escallonia herrerae]|uniref:Protein ABIL5 n=1 Tax=Escallonia herrerae TaxID=1293975 RepID=A0AA88WUF2_9ASTE|nr:hypothetical protein RJ639_032230 [Escallonia herrerae]